MFRVGDYVTRKSYNNDIVFKIIGIAFITSFGSEICKDAEASNIAHKIELSGKIMILVLAIPILMSLLESILKIM